MMAMYGKQHLSGGATSVVMAAKRGGMKIKRGGRQRMTISEISEQ